MNLRLAFFFARQHPTGTPKRREYAVTGGKMTPEGEDLGGGR